MANALGYIRVSTDEQGRSGLSLEHQRRQIAGYAELYGLTLADTVEDVASAKTLKREGLVRVLAILKRGDALIVAKLDRLTRSVRDLADLLHLCNRRGIALVSVAEHLDSNSASGRLVLNVLMSAAQWEREATAERTSAALRARRSRGLVATKDAPYGFRKGPNGRLDPEPYEQVIFADVQRQRAEGRTLRAIAADLNAQGRTTRAGGPWRHEYVARLLATERSNATAPAA